MQDPAQLPGYRRRIVVTPAADHAIAALEDDMHCMVVRLDHDGEVITRVTSRTERAPWNVCPSAAATLAQTFTGLPLAGSPPRAAKWTNCTHLHDLATLAAAHARDSRPTTWGIAASDPVCDEHGEVIAFAEVRANGQIVHRWQLAGMAIAAPSELAGMDLMKLRDWIATLPTAEAEAARLLQWAAMVAHGRQMTDWETFSPEQMPANCHAFQPGADRSRIERTGVRHDFSNGEVVPLDHFEGKGFAVRGRASIY